MKSKWFMLILSLLLIFGAVLVGGCVGTAPTVEVQTVTDVSTQEAHVLIQQNRDNPDFVVLDVRTPEEYADGHIASAVNLDFYSATFREELDDLDKDKTYLLYCRSGNRSGKTLDMMIELGFTKIYHMTGGIIEWNAAGLPITK